MFTRKCPKCNKTLYYKNDVTYNRAVRDNTLCRSCVRGECTNNNIKRLLSGELNSFYWLGFILADGHIGKNKRLALTLKDTDEEHLKSFCDYFSIKTYRKWKRSDTLCYVSTTAQDSTYIPKLTEKFDIKSNKTYNPPNISIFKKLKNEEILSLIIGFIDGDGCIKYQTKRKDWSIHLKTHSSWLEILAFFQRKIHDKYTSKINNRGYAFTAITDVPATIKLKKFALEKNLPILKRKWDKIDIDYVTYHEIAKKRLEIIKQMLKEGKSIKDIAKKIGITYTGVYNAIKRNKIK